VPVPDSEAQFAPTYNVDRAAHQRWLTALNRQYEVQSALMAKSL
jgi:hypothetical protein